MDRVGEGFGQIREKRRKFLKAVYDLVYGRPTAHVSKADVALRWAWRRRPGGVDEFMAIVQYFDDLGCIRTFQSGAEGYREYGDLKITGQGIDKVEQSVP